ncbi:HAD-IIIA family hydrolase [Bradyrhizobium canariense]|uniref:D,D-heptose 1,7-bisphosphate phosphatase n=1 Tax=Bradyrhizobium canariense TaxID=255045 RepID=A0A1H1M4E1_9BRAD|nr:HAD-IIIA family hydrolase [Bradyrhizobium canariense]SDR81684.1 D-glycero-D-manno-heptose 1,7-bisphosphate phosphatase [Bradyrhizobium canariense]
MLRQAVILVGGLGTRLGERTKTTPKPMLHVGGRPFLDTLIDEIARYDVFDEILLLAGHKAESIQARYAGAVRGRARLLVSLEQAPLGTGGALVHAASLLQERFLLLNGDSFFDFNILDLVSRASASLVHMALRADVVGDRYGRVVLDNDRVRAFIAPGQGATGPVNAGVYVIDRSIIAGINHLPVSLEQDIFPTLVANRAMTGTSYRGYFIDIGIPKDFARADVELNERLRRPAVFFDRDGVLNHDSGYIFEASKLRWIDGAREAVKAVNDAGYFAFVVTNQSGVARGFYQESHVQALHRWMADEMAVIGAHIDAFEYCPDHPEGTVERYRRVSDRRKPAPGMITDLLGRFAVDTDGSILIGDKAHDLEAARAAGLQGHLFAGGNLEAFVKQHLPLRPAYAPK